MKRHQGSLRACVCWICAKKFQARRRDAVLCSPSCRKTFSRKMAKRLESTWDEKRDAVLWQLHKCDAATLWQRVRGW